MSEDPLYNPAQFDQVAKNLGPLITKLTGQFHQQYQSFIEFDDAKQEILICLFRCLKRFQAGKGYFIPYFIKAVDLLKKNYYYRNFHSMNVLQKSGELSESLQYQEVKFEFHLHLSKESQEVYQLFLEEGRISAWLFARKKKKSRYFANPQYQKFVDELALLTQ